MSVAVQSLPSPVSRLDILAKTFGIRGTGSGSVTRTIRQGKPGLRHSAFVLACHNPPSTTLASGRNDHQCIGGSCGDCGGTGTGLRAGAAAGRGGGAELILSFSLAMSLAICC